MPIDSSHDTMDAIWAERRAWMVRTQLEARGIDDTRVLAAMGKIPREQFVPPSVCERAYADIPLPIGGGATISQPYIVARMTELARIQPGDRLLEIGTGSGYHAAVLDEMGAEVYTIENVPALALQARARLEKLGHARVRVRHGEGYEGWPEAAPFSAIIVTAAPLAIPDTLCDQLALGGRMVIPVGPPTWQHLMLVTRSEGGFDEQTLEPVAFIPMRRRDRFER